MVVTIIKVKEIFCLLWREECSALWNRYLESRKNILSALPFWAAGFLLILLGITYGFVATLRILLLDSGAQVPVSVMPTVEMHLARADLVITPFFYFVLLSIFFIIFCLMLEKARSMFYNLIGLEYLTSAPTEPTAIEIGAAFAFRFIRMAYFSVSSLLSLIFFGLAPLVALGLVTGAPWYYYLLILPVLYLFLTFPASLGVMVSLLLSKLLPAKLIVQLAGGVNFFLGFMWLAVFIFGIGVVLPPLLTQLETAEPMLSLIFPLNVAVAVAVATFEHLLRGDMLLALHSLGGLVLSGIAFLAFTAFLTQKLYYADHGKEQVRKSFVRKGWLKIFSGKKGSLILTDWKENFFDRDLMAGWSLFIVIGAPVYSFAAGRFLPQDPAWHNLVLLAHTGVSGFLAYIALAGLKSVVLLENQDTQNINIEVLKERDCRLYKAASLRSDETVWCKWIAFSFPAAVSSGLALFLVNIAIGSDAVTTLLSLAVLVLLLGSFLALDQWMELVIYSKGKGTLVQYASPYIYYIFGLGILVLGQVYQRLGFLGFMHHLPQETVTILSGAAFVFLTVFVFFYSLRLAARSWEEIKI